MLKDSIPAQDSAQDSIPAQVQDSISQWQRRLRQAQDLAADLLEMKWLIILGKITEPKGKAMTNLQNDGILEERRNETMAQAQNQDAVQAQNQRQYRYGWTTEDEFYFYDSDIDKTKYDLTHITDQDDLTLDENDQDYNTDEEAFEAAKDKLDYHIYQDELPNEKLYDDQRAYASGGVIYQIDRQTGEMECVWTQYDPQLGDLADNARDYYLSVFTSRLEYYGLISESEYMSEHEDATHEDFLAGKDITADDLIYDDDDITIREYAQGSGDLTKLCWYPNDEEAWDGILGVMMNRHYDSDDTVLIFRIELDGTMEPFETF